MTRRAVLLINLGTPDELSARAVRRYLQEFLNDARMVDLPALVRWSLVNFFIVPFRYKKTTHAYSKIWREDGSPLLTYTRDLASRLADYLGQNFHVEFAMRYGQPSIGQVLKKFHHPSSLTVIPLFPQYSSAANGSALEKLFLELKNQWNIPQVNIIHQFYNNADYIKAYAETIKSSLQGKIYDTLLFSYHGLPERHITKSACLSDCNRINVCPPTGLKNQFCYRAQCYETSALIAKELKLNSNQYEVGFQSRLGRIPWIKPYSDVLLPQLLQRGIKRLAVVCPSFIVDCLETLEEVNIRMREQWQQLGGEDFIYIPCLNESPHFIKALSNIIQT